MARLGEYAPGAVEAWMEGIGTRFVEVRFWLPKAEGWFTERHVADPETISTTIDMTASRIGARAAVWHDVKDPNDGWWCWCFRAGPDHNNARLWPNREAAEMYAIHRA